MWSSVAYTAVCWVYTLHMPFNLALCKFGKLLGGVMGGLVLFTNIKKKYKNLRGKIGSTYQGTHLAWVRIEEVKNIYTVQVEA